jgi:type III secretion system low calcium response chaperone LcrH/SycD
MTAEPITVPEPLANLIRRMREHLENLPSAKRLQESDAEGLYALAYSEYSRNRYDEALRYFQLLLVYRPTNCTYLLGAALCLRRLRKYALAVLAYSALCMLQPRDASHALGLAECQLLSQQHEAARQSLGMVISFCGEDAVHAPVRARAEAILELMRPRHVAVEA